MLCSVLAWHSRIKVELLAAADLVQKSNMAAGLDDVIKNSQGVASRHVTLVHFTSERLIRVQIPATTCWCSHRSLRNRTLSRFPKYSSRRVRTRS